MGSEASVCEVAFFAFPFFETMIYHIIGVRAMLIHCSKICFADTSLEKHG